jgi:hypothetical protein
MGADPSIIQEHPGESIFKLERRNSGDEKGFWPEHATRAPALAMKGRCNNIPSTPIARRSQGIGRLSLPVFLSGGLAAKMWRFPQGRKPDATRPIAPTSRAIGELEFAGSIRGRFWLRRAPIGSVVNCRDDRRLPGRSPGSTPRKDASAISQRGPATGLRPRVSPSRSDARMAQRTVAAHLEYCARSRNVARQDDWSAEPPNRRWLERELRRH